MNGIRASEIVDLLRAVESAGGADAVLATFVSVDGSVFARAGAMAVFVPGAPGRGGAVAVEELQGDLRREVEATAAAGPRLCVLDLPQDDPILGFGLGAPGRVEVWLEPANEVLRAYLRLVLESLLRGEGVVCALEIEGPKLGERRLHRPEEPGVRECYQELSPEIVEASAAGGQQRAFLCPVHPMGKAMIFGSGAAARALARHLSELGFAVVAADPRSGRLQGAERRLPGVRVVQGGWEQARAELHPDEETSVVVLTCSYALDLETLQGALKSPAAYVGLIGPQKRTEALLAELAALEVRPRPGTFFAPAGLDIGAEAPAEAALSIAAEILAARSGRKGGRLSSRRRDSEARAKAKVPGLILAAGPGTRFSAGPKLSA
ncbi:MAG: XdhC family protein, partial [Elusimicrobia bacterium]|nr:XdhC family protein [Elusimicrobiota bacterium]